MPPIICPADILSLLLTLSNKSLNSSTIAFSILFKLAALTGVPFSITCPGIG